MQGFYVFEDVRNRTNPTIHTFRTYRSTTKCKYKGNTIQLEGALDVHVGATTHTQAQVTLTKFGGIS
jgi:hypothetical protein